MIKTNIAKITNLKQSITLFTVKFSDQNIYSNKINEYIRKLRQIYNSSVTFNNYNSIMTDNEKIAEILKEIVGNIQFSVYKTTINFHDNNFLTKRYIGEAISQQLRNNFEKLVVTNQGKDWFKAVNYLNLEEYGRVKLFQGFRFKIIFLKGEIGIIIDPKSKFYTEMTLREMYDIDPEASNFYIEKLCPIPDCDEKFNPFATCPHAIPESFQIIGVQNFFKDAKPSDDRYRLITYYKNKVCKRLGSIIEDKSPIILHYFPNSQNAYPYPLEILRKTPSFDDAFDKTRALSDEVTLNPDERYERITQSLSYFEALKEENFPIIIENELLSVESNLLDYFSFDAVKYTVNEVVIEKNPYDLLKNGDISLSASKLNIYFIFFGVLPNLILDLNQYFQDFKKWYNCTLNYNFIPILNNDFEKIPKNTDQNDLYLILHNDEEIVSHLIQYLIFRNKKFHCMHLDTIRKTQFFKRENIFPMIYHKVFPPFFKLKIDSSFKEIIGLTIQNSGEKKLVSILVYNNSGFLIKGTYFKIRNSEFETKIIESVNDRNENSIFLINGLLTKKLREYFEKQIYVSISDNSIVRLFQFRYGAPSSSGVYTGKGFILGKESYYIGFESHQGTQKTIKITEGNLKDNNFLSITELCYKLSKYHLGYSENSMKLPFPIHYGKKLINRLKKIDIDEYSFDYPIYL